MLKKVYIARYHGFCMGVKRAINIAEETARDQKGPVTILNEIVHNEAVVDRFKREGVGQAFSPDDVETGTLIISAHGVSPDVKKKAVDKGLNLIDATCPLVENIYEIILKLVDDGYYVIHFGEKDHDETTGIVGYAPEHILVASTEEELLALPDWTERKLGLTVQTTAHQNEMKTIEKLASDKWPHIKIFNTICNATTQRQDAVHELAPKVDMMLVVGSKSSANSNRLAVISDSICGKGLLIGSADDVEADWFSDDKNIEAVGVTAGASTPDFLIEEVIERLVSISGGSAEVIRPVKKRRRSAGNAV